MQKSKFNSLDVLDSKIPSLIEKKNMFCWLHPDMYWLNPDFLDCTIKPLFPVVNLLLVNTFLDYIPQIHMFDTKKTQFWSRNLHSNGKLLVFLCFSVDIPWISHNFTALPPARAAAPPAPVVSDARVPAVQWCPLAWTPRKGGFGNKLGLKHTVFQQKSGFKHRTFWRFNRLVV